jgi:hypothetical protein
MDTRDRDGHDGRHPVVRLFLGVLLTLAFVPAWAAGVALFDARDAVPLTRAQDRLPPAELTRLMNQTLPSARSVVVVPLNFAALESTSITVTMDGKPFEYVGRKSCDAAAAGICIWKGIRPGSEGTLTLAVDDQRGVSGWLTDAGHVLRIFGAQGATYQAIADMP